MTQHLPSIYIYTSPPLSSNHQTSHLDNLYHLLRNLLKLSDFTMEKTSSNTLSPSTFSLSSFVLFLLYDIALSWVSGFKKFCSSSRCFFQSHTDFFYHGGSKKAAYSELSKQKLSLKEKVEEDEKLSRKEVEMVMGRLNIACEADDDQMLLDRLGSKELSNLFEEEEPRAEEVKAAFDVFDENRDGFVDAAELKKVLCVLGNPQGSKMEECEKMIRVYDENRDGLIDFTEFVKLIETSFF